MPRSVPKTASSLTVRALPGLLLGIAILAPIFGCDMLKKKDADAGAFDAAGLFGIVAVDAGVAPVDTSAAADAAVAPLVPATVTPTSTIIHPVVKTDGGTAPAPGPTPTLTIPSLPFDAGSIRFVDGGGGFIKPVWKR